VNTLVFVDLPASDLHGATRFYEELFGWQINPRPAGEFHQIVPGEDLHLGLFSDGKQPPDPHPKAVQPRSPNQPRLYPSRVYIKVDDRPELYVDKAVALGANGVLAQRVVDGVRGLARRVPRRVGQRHRAVVEGRLRALRCPRFARPGTGTRGGLRQEFDCRTMRTKEGPVCE
jgi:predicted enzyme related to lactoylglutathione lyase